MSGNLLPHFYSRPCGRGDQGRSDTQPARAYFYSRPCGRGDGIACEAIRRHLHFYSRPCGRGDGSSGSTSASGAVFLLTPLREGRHAAGAISICNYGISTHAPAGGATRSPVTLASISGFLLTPLREGRRARTAEGTAIGQFLLTPLREGRPTREFTSSIFGVFLLTPLREGRPPPSTPKPVHTPFLLTPLREGRRSALYAETGAYTISTHAPAGGATPAIVELLPEIIQFLLTPLREGRPYIFHIKMQNMYFYSRPCGRGDIDRNASTYYTRKISTHAPAGGATHQHPGKQWAGRRISTHAPAGGATVWSTNCTRTLSFLLTPLREGRPAHAADPVTVREDFYSRPCGRGDEAKIVAFYGRGKFLLTPLREGRLGLYRWDEKSEVISTHAPAGGATAIFHKSVMRFCGKLPKDDTVLCLASFGFPRRDPKAVYLAWISCANLPQKCVREGLALKDQGTSCFHEGLASHAFDPVLV